MNLSDDMIDVLSWYCDELDTIGREDRQIHLTKMAKFFYKKGYLQCCYDASGSIKKMMHENLKMEDGE